MKHFALGKCKDCYGYEYTRRPEVQERYRQKSRDWARVNPLSRLKTLLKYQYGINFEQYLAKFKAQGYKCAICRCALSRNIRNRKKVHVDHDHDTMRFRGILCNHCNAGLGHFKDDTRKLSKAIEYLRRNR